MFQTLIGSNFSYARELLIRQLKNRYRATTHQVIVVFDGDGAREQTSYDDHLCIIFSCHGETADSVIMRLASKAREVGREVEMYSDDEEIRSSVIEHGGKVKTSRQLTKKLTAAPHDVMYRSLYRQEMRRVYGIDPLAKHKDDEEEDRYQALQRGKKKKKKSSRRYR